MHPEQKTKSSKKLVIRKGDVADIELMRKAGWYMQEGHEVYHRYVLTHPEEQLNLLLAFVEDNLVGRVFADLHPEHPFHFKETAGIIVDLFVEVQSRNDGVCSALIKAAEDTMLQEGKTIAEIGVNRDNTLPLTRYVGKHYHQNAMKCSGEIAFRYYPPGIGTWVDIVRYNDAIVFHKNLSDNCATHPQEEINEITNNLRNLFDS